MKAGVYIGRFQPLHLAHLAVMLEALESVDSLIIVLGSALAARSVKNPFTAREREDMIRASLEGAGVDLGRLTFVPLRDFYDLERWAGEVRERVAALLSPADTPILLGFEKDASSAYLREFPGWTYQATEVRSSLSATQVRRDLLETGRILPGTVPPAVARFLSTFVHQPEFARLREEHSFLENWQLAWVLAPSPPAFVAVHVLAQEGGAVTLVRRSAPPGQALLALPGGLLHEGRWLQASALLHLQEQTGWTPSLSLSPARVFDHPDRSLLGREIAHVFPLTEGPTEQADTFVTLSLDEALARPEEFYADHHRILEVMLERDSVKAGGRFS